MNTTDWIGFIGVGFLLLAYMLQVTKFIQTKQLSYILMNIIGAGLACLASYLLNYWPFILLEAIWTAVSFISLIGYFKDLNKSTVVS